MGVVPIVNENDTIAVSDIKLGDNDKLSAITAAMIKADYLFLMTDADCLYDTNPRHNPLARAIEIVEDITSLKADGKMWKPHFGTSETKWQSLLRRIPIRQRGYVCQGRSSESSFVCRYHDNYNALLEPWKYRQPHTLFPSK